MPHGLKLAITTLAATLGATTAILPGTTRR
jgi:hypothetical protein